MDERNDHGQIPTDTSIQDPVARIQAYLDVYKNASEETWVCISHEVVIATLAADELLSLIFN